MTEIEKIKRYIGRTSERCKDRGMSLGDLKTLANSAGQDLIGAVIMAFDYGRAKGYRAAQARKKGSE